jgi:hypothetical protein
LKKLGETFIARASSSAVCACATIDRRSPFSEPRLPPPDRDSIASRLAELGEPHTGSLWPRVRPYVPAADADDDDGESIERERDGSCS